MPNPESVIIEHLQNFIAFARKRISDPHLAEDLVQDSLLKALQADHKPDSAEDIIAWFYRILRRSIIDLYRRNAVRNRTLANFQAELPESPNEETEAEICQCFRPLIAELPPQYQELLDRIDLKGEHIQDLAREHGQSRNNITVRLHRARKQLKARVEQLCKSCSVHGCLDCSCNHALAKTCA